MISKINLSNFRNFKNKLFEFSHNITVIVGPNAAGKTNILESLFLLSSGKSFKARVEGEMLGYGEELARVKGRIMNNELGIMQEDNNMQETTLEAVITTGENGWPKKRLLVNGVPKRLIDFTGNFPATLFGPWDMDLVTESPSIRRKFLDSVLSQVDREYRRSILSYEKGLRQRNRLLFRIREESLNRSQLIFWNQLLIKTGDYVANKRNEFIEFVNSTPRINDLNLKLEYDRSAISEGRLEQYAREEVASATTLVGPHRDDFIFKKDLESRDLVAYGSRGEQRMGVLWLKMAELDYIEKENAGAENKLSAGRQGSGRPTLLLDDIFSELDHEHRDVVMKLAQRQQTIITTADEHFLEGMKIDTKIELS